MISIIIPVLNEQAHLEKTLASVTGVPGVEVIIADGGSRDGSVQIAGRCGAKVINSRLGRARQMNAGAKAATGQILLFLHGDTALPEGFQTSIPLALEGNDVVAGAFRFAIDLPSKKFRLVERLTNMRAQLFQLPYGDQAIFLETERFWSLGGFEEIPIMEDFALMRKLKKQGRIKILDQAAITSGRRWDRLGVVRTACLNQMIILGYLLGASPRRLDRLYRFKRDGKER